VIVLGEAYTFGRVRELAQDRHRFIRALPQEI
jgi:hypothetical protein